MQTITHRVRTFLRQQGATIEPWSGLDATYSELYALLDRRRDDPALWEPLEQLLQEVFERATDPEAERQLAAPAAELLSSWDASELLASLRQALSEVAPATAPLAGQEYRSFTRQLPPAVLGAFLVLGLAAAGCAGNYDSESEGAGGTGGAATGGAATNGGTDGVTTGGGTGGVTTGGVTTGGGTGGDASSGGTGGAGACLIDDAQVLASTINDSALPTASKSSLCSCMTQLSESWRDGLTALFETGTPEQIATALEEMLVCCSRNLSSGSFSQNALLQGTLCEPFYGTGGMYKGVSFPN